MARTTQRGVPKRDGSGRGMRNNRGRGGCPITKPSGVGRGGFGRGVNRGTGQGLRRRAPK